MDLVKMIESDKPTLINFHATWCAPCRAMGPHLDEVIKNCGKRINYQRIDIDHHPQLAQVLMVNSIPTTYIFKNGKVVYHKTGILTALEMQQELKENL